jgi:hypothetical protein
VKAFGSAQVIFWDRGRPARNAPKALSASKVAPNPFSRFALICGRDARGPRKSLEWFLITVRIFAGIR